MFKCICGKEFKSKQALNGHQANCKKYLGEERYLKILNNNRMAQSKAKQTRIDKNRIKQEQKLQQWIFEKHVCEKCGKVMTEKYASGRFCCKECARGFSNYKGSFKPEVRKKYNIPIPVKTKDIAIMDGEFKCPECERRYRTQSGLTQHIKRMHNEFYQLNNFILIDNKSIGITYNQLEEYRKNHTKCEICGKSVEDIRKENNHFHNLCIDHNHTTNQFRGLLCMTCNRALGWFEKNEKNILNYLNNKGREL